MRPVLPDLVEPEWKSDHPYVFNNNAPELFLLLFLLTIIRGTLQISEQNIN